MRDGRRRRYAEDPVADRTALRCNDRARMTKIIGFPTLIPAGVMTPTVAKIHVLTVLLLVTSTCLAARPRAPLPELQRAAAALVRAEEAGAATYAPLDLRYAGEQLEQARQLHDGGDIAGARRLLEQSLVNSDLAAAKSQLGRTREAVQVQAAANARLRSEAPLPATDTP